MTDVQLDCQVIVVQFTAETFAETFELLAKWLRTNEHRGYVQAVTLDRQYCDHYEPTLTAYIMVNE